MADTSRCLPIAILPFLIEPQLVLGFSVSILKKIPFLTPLQLAVAMGPRSGWGDKNKSQWLELLEKVCEKDKHPFS